MRLGFIYWVISLSSLYVTLVNAQSFRNPFDFPILLSGNFGELRSNHFHSGIDFKTQMVEGKPVHTAQEGYVSRISVSPWGYGNALYITHPNGTTTVYGHLQKFSKKIADYVKKYQYEVEHFDIDLTLPPDTLPVENDEIIALSGNTGSSGGPHLHFEVRDTQTGEVMDPLMYFLDSIADTRPPQILGIMIIPMKGTGVVNGRDDKLKITPTTNPNGRPTINKKIEAWGEIGLAIKTYDRMDNTSNIYGVKEITLLADSQIIFHSDLDKFAFDETRYINTLTDYEEWKENRSFFIRGYIEPGNRLRFLQSANRGKLYINEKRTYHLTYLLTDAFGNTTRLSIPIEGKEQNIPSVRTKEAELFHWNSDNRFGAKGIRLYIPKDNLYDNIYFRYSVKEDSTALASIHTLHDHPVALHQGASLSLFLRNDTLENKQQYGVVRLQNGRASWLGGKYRNGWIDATIKELGTYTIRQDTTPPKITPLTPASWVSKQKISLRLTDNLSGVKTYRGEIDGRFALFEMDKRSIISYRFDKERLQKGEHDLKLTVTDACGNISTYTYSFTWR